MADDRIGMADPSSPITPGGTALCNDCLGDVPYVIRITEEGVALEKTCTAHGVQHTVLSTDTQYWKRCEKERAKRAIAGARDGAVELPHMVIVEALDECDVECPTCLSSSVPGSGNFRSPSELVERIGRLTEATGPLPLLMISGGEPALHPEITRILHASIGFAQQLMLITNGIRIANDIAFVEKLAALGDKFEVYLQFDSMSGEALLKLRGRDLRLVRQRALSNLQQYGVGATLVCVVKRGVNDSEPASIVRLACEHSNVRGVTFQPIRSSGRNLDYRHEAHHITLSEIRRGLVRGLDLPDNALIPHPVNPERICIGYIRKVVGHDAVTGKLFNPDAPYYEAVARTLYPGRDLTDSIVGATDWLRIAIVCYLDKYDYTTVAASQGGIAFLTDEEMLIPFEQRFMFD